jgi:hypothetical protein
MSGGMERVRRAIEERDRLLHMVTAERGTHVEMVGTSGTSATAEYSRGSRIVSIQVFVREDGNADTSPAPPRGEEGALAQGS